MFSSRCFCLRADDDAVDDECVDPVAAAGPLCVGLVVVRSLACSTLIKSPSLRSKTVSTVLSRLSEAFFLLLFVCGENGENN